ncbi:hypothetical protein BD413DRAFT_636059 [Trametes elegans]|nr:hypothetical protein BD413DRAFT_636059 [Trametes elegans]
MMVVTLNSLPPAVFAHILDQLPTTGDFPSKSAPARNLHALTVLARTCRALSEPALNRIWRALPSLVPLVCTMPRDLWTMGQPLSKDGRQYPWTRIQDLRYIKFKRMVVRSDFDRFLHYSRRVVAISADAPVWTCSHLAVDVEARAALELALPVPYLLPNLRELHLFLQGVHDVELWKLMVSPKLQIVDISYEGYRLTVFSTLELKRFLERVVATSDGLSHLTIDLKTFPPELQKHVEAALLGMTRLTSFSWVDSPPLRPAVLHHFSELAHLQSLTLQIHGVGKTGAQLFSGLSSECFPALRNLRLTTDVLDWTSSVLLRTRRDTLLNFTLKMTQPVSADALKTLFDTLGVQHASLTALEVSLPTGDGAQDVFPPDTLWPLIALRLRTLDLGSCPVAVDAPFMRACAIAWPELRALCIGVRCGRDVRPRGVSLLALAELVGACPELRAVGLALDTADIPPRALLEDCPPLTQNGFSLCVGRSRVEQPLEVGIFLSRLFPNLEWLHTSWQDDVDRYEEESGENAVESRDPDVVMALVFSHRWATVGEVVNSPWEVRQQERRAVIAGRIAGE